MKKYGVNIKVIKDLNTYSELSPSFLNNLIISTSYLKSHDLKKYTDPFNQFSFKYIQNKNKFIFIQENLSKKYIIPYNKTKCASLEAKITISKDELNTILSLYRMQKNNFNANDYFYIKNIKSTSI